MSSTRIQPRVRPPIRRGLLAVCCLGLVGPGASGVRAQEKPPAADTAAVKLPPEQLDALVAPIALYPDDLLAQTLVASTYPLEIVQLQQWMAKHPGLKDKALADSVARQPWDPSVQSMAAVPEVVKRLADDIQWTTELGNAFLAQQGDVMNSVQRMRTKAKGNGALESNQQQKVETKVVEKDTVIIVQSTSPEIIYVPAYSPTIVYGPPPPYYPYPPIYYPPYPPGGAFVTFGFGMMMGAAIWGGSCCHAGWGGGNTVIINNNNNFNQINHNRGGAGSGNGNWQHNPEHRGGTPYGDKATANKYGGGSRGQSAGGGARPGTQPSAGARPAGQPSAGARPASQPSVGGAGGRSGGDQIGSRDIPKSSGTKPSAMSGGSGGFSGSSARASSSRGASSMGSRGGGGGRRR
jgi:hypothetical protein